MKKDYGLSKTHHFPFNIILAGLGGQGIITLTQILAETALIENCDLKTSELHGLSQRGGSVETHIRFSPSEEEKVYSPLVGQGEADLIISLEAQEALKVSDYNSKRRGTCFLVNDFIKPIFGVSQTPSTKKIKKELEKIAKKVILIPADQICKNELGTSVTAGVFLLAQAYFKNLIPLKESSILKAVKRIIPKKYLEINLKTLALAKEWSKKEIK